MAKIQGRLTRNGRPVTAAWVGGVRVRSERKLPYVDIQRGRTVRTEWNPFSFAAASSSGGYSLELRKTIAGTWWSRNRIRPRPSADRSR